MKKNDNKNVDGIVMLRSGKTKVGKEEFYCIKKNKWNFGILMLTIQHLKINWNEKKSEVFGWVFRCYETISFDMT